MARSPSGVRAEHTWVGSGAPAQVALRGSERAHLEPIGLLLPAQVVSRKGWSADCHASEFDRRRDEEYLHRFGVPGVLGDPRPLVSVRDRLALKRPPRGWRPFRP